MASSRSPAGHPHPFDIALDERSPATEFRPTVIGVASCKCVRPILTTSRTLCFCVYRVAYLLNLRYQCSQTLSRRDINRVGKVSFDDCDM